MTPCCVSEKYLASIFRKWRRQFPPLCSRRNLKEAIVLQVAMAVTGFLGSVVMIGSVNRLGKRSLAMSSVAVCALSCLLLGVYDYLFVDRATWVPLVLFTVFSFANSIQGQIPWLLVAEAFPFRYCADRQLSPSV